MCDPETLKHHADLVDRMATQVGVDLEEVVLAGDLPFEEIADSVLRCTRCASPGACAAWLDQPGPATQIPGYCQNRDVFTDLATKPKQP